jgi:hypothetical protein
MLSNFCDLPMMVLPSYLLRILTTCPSMLSASCIVERRTEQRILSIARSHRRRDAFKLARDRQRMLGPCHVFNNSTTLHPPFFANRAKAGPNSSLLLPSRLSLAFLFASSLNSITLIFPSSMILLLPFFLK